MTYIFLTVMPTLSDPDDSMQIPLTTYICVVLIKTENLQLIAPLRRSHRLEKQSDLQHVGCSANACLCLRLHLYPFLFLSTLSRPLLPLPPLPALGSLYLYPFQSEGSQSVSDLSSLIPTFKPAALKSLFDITRELSCSPLYLSAGEDPPKSHLALLGKHSPSFLPSNTM